MQSHHAEALQEYLHAYRLQPDEPLVLLSIACTYISQVRHGFQLPTGFLLPTGFQPLGKRRPRASQASWGASPTSSKSK